MSHAYIGLGSNMGDSIHIILEAFNCFTQNEGIFFARLSPFYLTSPMYVYDQNDFINAVLELHTSRPSEELLQLCFLIETRFQRVRKLRNGPRTLDCDILLYQDEKNDSAHFTLPHPRMHERLFVLAPLKDLVGDINLSNHGRISDCMAKLSNQTITRIFEPLANQAIYFEERPA